MSKSNSKENSQANQKRKINKEKEPLDNTKKLSKLESKTKKISFNSKKKHYENANINIFGANDEKDISNNIKKDKENEENKKDLTEENIINLIKEGYNVNNVYNSKERPKYSHSDKNNTSFSDRIRIKITNNNNRKEIEKKGDNDNKVNKKENNNIIVEKNIKNNIYSKNDSNNINNKNIITKLSSDVMALDIKKNNNNLYLIQVMNIYIKNNENFIKEVKETNNSTKILIKFLISPYIGLLHHNMET